MLCNLRAEMARHNIGTADMATALGKTPKTIYNKIAEQTEFTVSEMFAIADMFPNCTLDYLFSSDKGGNQ